MNEMHVFYGRRKGKRQRGERCIHCGDKPKQGAYTYFGGFVCEHCWDHWWRLQEDGECDPPFSDFDNTVSGEWITA